MHICFITNEYPKQDFSHGGVGTFIRTLSRKLVKKGHKVTVIGINFYSKIHEEEDDNGVIIYRLKPNVIKGFTWYYNNKSISKRIKLIDKDYPIDIVETAELGLAFISKIKSIKYIIRLHGGHHFFAKYEKRKVKLRQAFVEKKSFRKADALIAVSDFVGKETLQLLGLQNRTYTVVFNPIDVNQFYQSDLNKIEKHSIFFAGTLVEKKGIRQLIEALNYLIDEFPNVKLLIAGRDANIPGTNIPYRPLLEKSITNKLEPHLEFLGVVPNSTIPSYIEKAQVCCYPSHMEAMPLAWLEVMAMSKIFIGSSIGPGREAVIDGVTGYLVNPLSPVAIAEKIKYVFNNYETCTEIAKKGRKRICEEFDINNIVEKNINTYNEIVVNT
ncbi:glycosyltransferase family 4 protein [uncultured Winogradskyella sp.]|uniref:glycosyltransferase family 4 protein n=1 Tax=uncultured Winogradskyella sp. TaxID=395353 RepID=UPI0026217D29|nr:glycosyltransferase family 4 protein [uncultured Winogradskyella sp.]|tara:strand:+ start:312 stop:1463 length:1152 start_codon:yes stop_codon:yes gene_type:complete